MRNILEGALFAIALLALLATVGFIATKVFPSTPTSTLKSTSAIQGDTAGRHQTSTETPQQASDSIDTHERVVDGLSSDATMVSPLVKQLSEDSGDTKGGISMALGFLTVLTKAKLRSDHAVTTEEHIAVLEQIGPELRKTLPDSALP